MLVSPFLDPRYGIPLYVVRTIHIIISICTFLSREGPNLLHQVAKKGGRSCEAAHETLNMEAQERETTN